VSLLKQITILKKRVIIPFFSLAYILTRRYYQGNFPGTEIG